MDLDADRTAEVKLEHGRAPLWTAADLRALVVRRRIDGCEDRHVALHYYEEVRLFADPEFQRSIQFEGDVVLIYGLRLTLGG